MKVNSYDVVVGLSSGPNNIWNNLSILTNFLIFSSTARVKLGPPKASRGGTVGIDVATFFTGWILFLSPN